MLLALSTSSFFSMASARTAPERPNVILFLIDDLGWADLGLTGSTFYETPHIDALAAEGVFFSDAYAANPVCSPTRASILTGKYPSRIGLTNHSGYAGPQGPNQSTQSAQCRRPHRSRCAPAKPGSTRAAFVCH
jgi:arylsulfatase A-like enzyme